VKDKIVKRKDYSSRSTKKNSVDKKNLPLRKLFVPKREGSKKRETGVKEPYSVSLLKIENTSGTPSEMGVCEGNPSAEKEDRRQPEGKKLPAWSASTKKAQKMEGGGGGPDRKDALKASGERGCGGGGGLFQGERSRAELTAARSAVIYRRKKKKNNKQLRGVGRVIPQWKRTFIL